MGNSNRNIKYICTSCHTIVGREALTVKRVVFARIGEGGKTLRSRTASWLCEPCRDADGDWNKPKLLSAPGSADFVMEQI